MAPDSAESYEHERLSRHAASEANWFFLIVALSIANEALPRLGLALYFVAGLAATRLADIFAHTHSAYFGASTQTVGYALAALPLIAFVVLGLLARKGRLWAWLAGIALYAADGVVFLLYREYLSAGFHAFVLYFLGSGLISALSAHHLRAKAPLEPEAVAEPPLDDKPSSNSLYPHS
jgi:hypothetical protein